MRWCPVTRISLQVPARKYEQDRAHEARMQLVEITVTGH